MPLALAAFFLSGFAALLYQVVWQRLLVIFTGVDVHSVTLIVAAYMAGLGIGNLVGGVIADRRTPRENLWLFAAAEVAIGLFGLFSKAIYYDLLYGRLSHLSASALSGPLLFVSLLWPTFFMGVSLPLLTRALTRELFSTGRIAGSLYGWNTIGAAAGAFATTWIVLPWLGMTGAIVVGAALNGLCVIVAVLLRRRVRDEEAPAAIITDRIAPERSIRSSTVTMWVLFYALAGFVALSLEIVWFRLLGVLLKSTAFTFGTLLGVYLLGIGGGAALGARVVERYRQPGPAFLVLQTLAVLLSAITLVVFLEVMAEDGPQWLQQHLARTEYNVADAVSAVADVVSGNADARSAGVAREFVLIFALLPSLLVGVPTLLMGFAFPFLQKAVHADHAHIGRRVGVVMTANIAGSVTGAALTGLVLLPSIGTAATLRVLTALAVVPAVAFGMVAIARRWRIALSLSLAAASLVAAAAIPNGARLWSMLHATPPHRVIAEEDGAGVTVLKAAAGGFDRQTLVFVNGLSQSWVPFGNIHTVLGALPLVIHPGPAEIAIIGLGSGDTAFSAAALAGTRRIVCVEIIGGQVAALERLHATFPYPGLTQVLSDPRIEHVVGDGRSYILRGGRQFDIIEADALRPGTAHSGNLYSREYFELLRRHLQPNGLAVTWAPTDRVARTFSHVFPHVLALKDIYIGSNEPIRFDRQEIAARMRDPRFVEYFHRGGIDIGEVLAPYVNGPVELLDAASPRRPGDLNSDVFPRDEFSLR